MSTILVVILEAPVPAKVTTEKGTPETSASKFNAVVPLVDAVKAAKVLSESIAAFKPSLIFV